MELHYFAHVIIAQVIVQQSLSVCLGLDHELYTSTLEEGDGTCMTSLNSRLAKYGLALVSVMLVFAARFILEPVLGVVSPLGLFILAVTVSAWYGGFGPGLVATVISVLLGDYYFVEPIHSFRMSSHNLPQQVELLLFLLTGFAISVISQERITSEARRQ